MCSDGDTVNHVYAFVIWFVKFYFGKTGNTYQRNLTQEMFTLSAYGKRIFHLQQNVSKAHTTQSDYYPNLNKT